ncbi:hypothetical protein AB0L85_15955 [Streptomyces sp. NPDC052051]|uniref:hypothetical protein n=1 Tax=Streptomyces sp. NPDC052051 TaxID=3154649 RepID=UPI00342BB50B
MSVTRKAVRLIAACVASGALVGAAAMPAMAASPDSGRSYTQSRQVEGYDHDGHRGHYGDWGRDRHHHHGGYGHRRWDWGHSRHHGGYGHHRGHGRFGYFGYFGHR